MPSIIIILGFVPSIIITTGFVPSIIIIFLFDFDIADYYIRSGKGGWKHCVGHCFGSLFNNQIIIFHLCGGIVYGRGKCGGSKGGSRRGSGV